MEDKKAYQDSMETKLSELGVKIDQLQVKAEKAGTDAKANFNQQIEDLKTKRHAMQQKLAEFKSSGDEAWASMQTGLKSAWDELSSAVEDAASKFK
ncbi:sll1863 family stress response protein [Nodularia spumigena]|jgi:cell division septum initiation protein DivIVA|uniref:hypothetical protein n=1 Tax=Nodularia spumigena TaxID=70799 RepID=UPI002B2142ED|nr:hypothetical protein [Nodularia spumigena]MEA5556499.1 hypothetical protein [Nodularia spumigena CH309]